MNMFGHADDADSRLAAAASWRVRLTEAGLHSTPEFDAWLRDADNKAAWEQVAHAWNRFDGAAQSPEMIAARQAALADAQRGNPGPARVRRLVGAIAAVFVVALVGTGGFWWNARPADYQTAAGERRVITLADGSKLSLDADSEVTVRYEKHARSLQLLRGQARFDVAHDKTRPFSVLAGNQKVVATGTAFNIDMGGPKVLVTLIEGHVIVWDESSAGAPHSIELRAGQQLAVAPRSTPEVLPANLKRVTAWTVGQIMFDDEPLSSVVERVNRYGGTQIVITDPKVGAMKISGVFNAGDTMGFVEIVTHYLPVQAVSEGTQAIALQSQPNTNKKPD